MTESRDVFDRIDWDCLRQTHLPPGPLVPIIMRPSQMGCPQAPAPVEGVISGG